VNVGGFFHLEKKVRQRGQVLVTSKNRGNGRCTGKGSVKRRGGSLLQAADSPGGKARRYLLVRERQSTASDEQDGEKKTPNRCKICKIHNPIGQFKMKKGRKIPFAQPR